MNPQQVDPTRLRWHKWGRTSSRSGDDELTARLDAVGFFAPPGWSYVIKAFVLSMLCATAYTTLLLAPDWPVRAVVLIGASIVHLQFGMLAHDCGHFAISRRRLVNTLWGHIGMSLVNGMSFSYWQRAHNAHHRHAQEQSRDPDMQFSLPLAAYEDDLERRSTNVLRLIRFQAWYVWPLTLLYWVSVRRDGLVYLVAHPRRSRIDRVGLSLHYGLWLGVPAAQLGPGAAVLNYLVLSSLLTLLTASVFMVGHIGRRPIRAGHEPGWLRQQTEHSRNIRGGLWADLFFCGLNRHIEHHLFPGVGHARLRVGSPVVRAFSAEHGIEYPLQPFGSALWEVGARLAEVGRAAARLRAKRMAASAGDNTVSVRNR